MSYVVCAPRVCFIRNNHLLHWLNWSIKWQASLNSRSQVVFLITDFNQSSLYPYRFVWIIFFITSQLNCILFTNWQYLSFVIPFCLIVAVVPQEISLDLIFSPGPVRRPLKMLPIVSVLVHAGSFPFSFSFLLELTVSIQNLLSNFAYDAGIAISVWFRHR